MADTQTQPTPRVPAWTVGDKLRKARTEAGISVAQMAERLGRDASSITRYEKARHVHLLVIRAYASETGVPFEWLANGEDERVSTAVTLPYFRRRSDNSRLHQDRSLTFTTAA